MDNKTPSVITKKHEKPETAPLQTRDKVASDVPSEMLPVDWFRFAILVGTGGMAGGKISLFGIKLDNAFINPLQGGGLAGRTGTSEGHSYFGGYTFVGMDVGYMFQKGHDVLIVGGLCQFTWISGKDSPASSSKDSSVGQNPILYGLGVGPFLKYRRYWGRFGLEISIDLPVVIGLERSFDGTTNYGFRVMTPLPIFGLSFGM